MSSCLAAKISRRLNDTLARLHFLWVHSSKPMKLKELISLSIFFVLRVHGSVAKKVPLRACEWVFLGLLGIDKSAEPL